jgi:hypothetical protein
LGKNGDLAGVKLYLKGSLAMKKIWFAVLILLVSGLSVMAQKKEAMNFDDYVQLVRSEMRTAVKQLITDNMGFTAQESEAFWPVYANYEKENATINDELQKAIKDYAAAYEKEKVPDKTAEELLQRSLKIQKDRIALQERYIPKFKKVLPVTKTVCFFQIMNKVQAIINIQLAAEIPLVK